tara:strand:- start:186 stop:377 length:192 start_codon:yes stop_codon:yes gene_type:complete
MQWPMIRIRMIRIRMISSGSTEGRPVELQKGRRCSRTPDKSGTLCRQLELLTPLLDSAIPDQL